MPDSPEHPDSESALVWFRRDLRDDDHAALFHALAAHRRVYCVFVFDITILAPLPRADRRVEFILRAVEELAASLRQRGGGLIVLHGDPVIEIPRLAIELGAAAVYCNRDYEPAAIARDDAVADALRRAAKADFRQFKDQVIFERDEVLTLAGNPFTVFTPYNSAWRKRLTQSHVTAWPVARHVAHLAPPRPEDGPPPSLAKLGFEATDLAGRRLPTGMSGAQQLFADFMHRIERYADARDYPAVKGPSYLSAHLRFGTISIRRLAAHAFGVGGRGAETWLSELIWRDFYQMVLWSRPDVVTHCFKPQCDALRWDDAPHLLTAWRQGDTGYPLVDAAMRQLLQTGYMHNRLRMVTASFLTKDLGLDWRLGETWFAEHLIDYDLAANNGGWQWAASTGCDAQPWFRIFNPVTQSKRFDADGRFIRRYVPELASVPDRHIHAPWAMPDALQAEIGLRVGQDYPAPVVDHALARQRTLERFKELGAGAPL